MTVTVGRTFARVRRFADDARGNVAMMLGLAMPVLILMTMGGVDLHRISTVRMNLQDALDAAALAAARSPYVTDAELTEVGWRSLQANLADYPGITAQLEDVTFTLQNDEIIVSNASVDVRSIAAHIFLPPYGWGMDETVPVSAHAEVNRATKDIEVSLVLDITGSMEPNNRIEDLQKAAKDLVDLVVQPNQDINRTRMALVPYSMGVNAGPHLNKVRGEAIGPKSISGATWSTGSSKTISALSKANPGVFTVSSHGYADGAFVWISGVVDKGGSGDDLAGWLNDKAYRVKRINSNSFSLERWNGSSWVALSTSTYEEYKDSGKVQGCLISTCEVVVTTSSNHDLATNDDVRITDVRGMTQINTHNAVSRTSTSQPPLSRVVTRLTNTTFALNGINPTTTLSAYTSGGKVQCLKYGCQNFLFTNNSNSLRVFGATDCVTERVGDNAYTDASAATSPVAFSYTGTDDVAQGGCMSTRFTPLTSDRQALKTAIDGYKPEGGTAGQIGVAWGWYMVSPTFVSGSLLPDNRPDAYGTRNLLKVVVLMTDGEFNAVHFNGVRARDSGVGGGNNDRWINHNSSNGNPFQQSARLCDAMKANNIIIYTVGFDVSEQNDPTPTKGGVNTVDTAQDVMEYCATNPQHVYLPENGTSLKTAFSAIGRSISRLRISK